MFQFVQVFCNCCGSVHNDILGKLASTSSLIAVIYGKSLQASDYSIQCRLQPQLNECMFTSRELHHLTSKESCSHTYQWEFQWSRSRPVAFLFQPIDSVFYLWNPCAHTLYGLVCNMARMLGGDGQGCKVKREGA